MKENKNNYYICGNILHPALPHTAEKYEML